MVLAIIILIIALFALLIFRKLGLKTTGIILGALVLCSTAIICVIKPIMHKPFSINVIEYLIKVNDDGSVTTTKQTTTTVLEEKVQKWKK